MTCPPASVWMWPAATMAPVSWVPASAALATRASAAKKVRCVWAAAAPADVEAAQGLEGIQGAGESS